MEIKESGITFIFSRDYRVLKFDDSPYYRKEFNHLPGGKGVDFIADSKERILLIEVKNCTGRERENRSRTKTSTGESKNEEVIGITANTFDEEIPLKIAMTLACLIGAHSKHQRSEHANELELYFQAIISEGVCNLKKEIIVVVVLEGNFGTASRSKKMILDRLQKSIRKKLDWLFCNKVIVVDSDTYQNQYFQMIPLSSS